MAEEASAIAAVAEIEQSSAAGSPPSAEGLIIVQTSPMLMSKSRSRGASPNPTSPTSSRQIVSAQQQTLRTTDDISNENEAVHDIPHVQLQSCQLQSITLENMEQALGKKVRPSSIRVLDASDNEIDKVRGLGICSTMIDLNLSYNRLSSLKGTPLTLTRLVVAHNRLTSLAGLEGLSSLHELDIGHNLIKDLKPLGRTSHLRILRARNNRIYEFEGLEALTDLEVYVRVTRLY
jgi:Leucine-rich repeat (LRR) protein